MLLDLPDLQAKMSLEQLGVYVLDHTALTLLLMAAVLGGVLASALIFSLQLAEQGRRMMREARADKARRLRYLADGSEVVAPELSDDSHPEWAASKGIAPWHFFPSHNWAQGQSDMRVVKQRLLEMIPELRVFLDVDNLGTGTLNSAHVDISSSVMCFCTQLFFRSGPCAQEVVRTVVQKKPVFVLLEPDKAAGGLTEAECRRVFADNPDWTTEIKPRIGKLEDKLAKWRVDWKRPELVMPTTAEVEAALFAQPPIIWSRLSAFQDVSMRLIAERILRCCPPPLRAAERPLGRAQPNAHARLSKRSTRSKAAMLLRRLRCKGDGSGKADGWAPQVYGSVYEQVRLPSDCHLIAIWLPSDCLGSSSVWLRV